MTNIPSIPNIDQITSFGKENVEAMVKSSSVAAQGLQDLAKAYTAFATQITEQTSSAVKALSSVKSPAEFQSVYNTVAKQNFETFISESRKLQEAASSLVTSSFAPLATRFQAAQSAIKPNA